MIRHAEISDIPAILDLLEELHGLAPRPLGFERKHAAGKVAVAINGADWLVLVVDIGGVLGLIIASAGVTTISPRPVAIEHALICRIPGWGARLIGAYEAWAVQRGCVAAHLAMLPGDTRMEARLARAGYVAAEAAYVKVI